MEIQLQSLLLLFTLCVSSVTSQGNGKTDNYFVNPPASNSVENPIWTLGEQQVISWDTTIEIFNISIWQQDPSQAASVWGPNLYSSTPASVNLKNFTWVVQIYDFDLDYSPIFYLWIDANKPAGFTSNYFNVTRNNTSTATASVTAITITATAAPTPTSSSSSTAAASTQDPTNLSTSTAKIALGVGIGIGVPVAAMLGVLIWLKSRQTKNVPVPATTMMMPPPMAARYPRPMSAPKEIDGHATAEVYPELPDQRYL